MKRPLLKFLLLSPLVLTAYGCGGGDSSDPASQTLAEGIAPEDIPAEDIGFADRDLVPPSFVVVTPRVGAGTGSAWVTWPESLALNVEDANNLYASKDQALSWPGDAGGIYSSRADCSGYVTRSLMKAFEFTAADLEAWMGSKGPSSARYHDNILFQNNFQRIRRAVDVQRGDILASKYLDRGEHVPGQPSGSGGTGHTMIAASAPVLRSAPSKPFVDGTVQYELRIIDSTSSPHSTGDTRKGTGANGDDQDGAGLGTMRLYADASSGEIVGYTWSLSSGSVYYTATSPAGDRRSLVVGRMTFTQ
jgi:hypothetical protein